MRLGELSEQTGISPASIKFYLREGLLDAGERINPTRAAYGEKHVQRLQMIQVLRTSIGLGLEDIRRIIDASAGADTSQEQRLALLETLQSVVLGLEAGKPGGSTAGDGLIRDMKWPDVRSDARDAVDRQLTAMEALGAAVEPRTLAAYARAADAIADAQLSYSDTQGSVEDLIITAAIGMHTHTQLIVKLVGLAQASHSIRRYGGAGDASPQAGPVRRTPHRS
jgi:DNA-binding transcriptional MerR regulator